MRIARWVEEGLLRYNPGMWTGIFSQTIQEDFELQTPKDKRDLELTQSKKCPSCASQTFLASIQPFLPKGVSPVIEKSMLGIAFSHSVIHSAIK